MQVSNGSLINFQMKVSFLQREECQSETYAPNASSLKPARVQTKCEIKESGEN